MRNQGIWWQGIPHKENRQGKQGIDKYRIKVFFLFFGEEIEWFHGFYDNCLARNIIIKSRSRHTDQNIDLYK